MTKDSQKLYISLQALKTFISIIFASIIFNFFISGILNVHNRINTLKNIDFISAELQRNLSTEQKRHLEEKLLLIPEIKKVTYIDSFIAFQNLQKDLGIVLPKGENPLPDSLRIYVNNLNNMDKIQKTLDSTQEIKEYFINTAYSNNINKQIKFLTALTTFFMGGTCFIVFIIIIIASMRFKIDYIGNLINNGYSELSITFGKLSNLIPLSLSILIGAFFYFNFYFLSRNWLITNEITFSLLTFFQLLKWQLFANILLIVGICNIPVKELQENI